jgi:hypothetical protein
LKDSLFQEWKFERYVYYTRMYMISIMQVASETNTLTMIFQSLIIFNQLFLICVYASKTPPWLIVIMFVDDGLTYNDNNTTKNDTNDHMKTKFDVTIINVDMYVWLCIQIDHI